MTSAEKHSGGWSQMLGPSTATDFGWLRQVTAYGSIQAGKTYKFSVWIKSTVTDGWGWNVFRIDVMRDDAVLQHVNMPQQETPYYDWREIAWQETVPEGYGINRVGAVLTRHWKNGSAWYDDISISEVNNDPPTIAVEPASITGVVRVGRPAPEHVFTVRNSGGSTLNYTIATNAAWLDVEPDAGTSDGETDTISLVYILANLVPGPASTVLEVADPAATNTPLHEPTVSVTVTVHADLDLDLDVDQEDFGLLQKCMTGDGIPVADPQCEMAKLDADSDVDQFDVAAFQSCYSGPNVLVNLSCALP